MFAQAGKSCRINHKRRWSQDMQTHVSVLEGLPSHGLVMFALANFPMGIIFQNPLPKMMWQLLI